jgi:hypothetical protein
MYSTAQKQSALSLVRRNTIRTDLAQATAALLPNLTAGKESKKKGKEQVEEVKDIKDDKKVRTRSSGKN